MAPPHSIVHLPNGHNLTVTPVFGGLYFKANELSNNNNSPFPPGWTIVINSDDEDDYDLQDPSSTGEEGSAGLDDGSDAVTRQTRRHTVHRFKKPTLRGDHLYISSISQPSGNEFNPIRSPSRQIAMMMWASLWWYFHQPAPDTEVTTRASAKTPAGGKPRGEWRININREGIFKGRVVLPKLERMGLIASEESCVGVGDERQGDGWRNMFVSRRHFWQLDARIYLFTLPSTSHSPYPGNTPHSSRPGSPSGALESTAGHGPQPSLVNSAVSGAAAAANNSGGGGGADSPSTLRSPGTPHAHHTHHSVSGPFHSTSHLPTYYPPPPPQYVYTADGTRHPLRPKPPRQGETFYTRYIPSLGQYLSFRVASASDKPAPHRGPVGQGGAGMQGTSGLGGSSSNVGVLGVPRKEPAGGGGGNGGGGGGPRGSGESSVVTSPANSNPALRHGVQHHGSGSMSDSVLPTLAGLALGGPSAHSTAGMCDTDLLHRWMNDARVARFWGENGPREHQEKFLDNALRSRHSFPVIGCWDGRPFGYFEIYWVKEDGLARRMGGDVRDYDRGFHCLVGEQEFRGAHRVKVWLSALVHYCWLADNRTESVMLEPRVDNEKLKLYLEDVGFFKEREVTFPHKQSNLMKIRRDAWVCPEL
ncbi:hypothetical protein BDY21DRAFT_335544 [Lineolata rhizophorae]|uniref:Acyltransferase MbtK/IucB-like conserved domain-containing protein n=1 Tax=Lineolata rhizophorae TaxID=578093 RepID=A0A6A6P961_9PEZI|nr:hypothetical protein BDY21DRAFT_335544 [Lineolata rhizophorae]